MFSSLFLFILLSSVRCITYNISTKTSDYQIDVSINDTDPNLILIHYRLNNTDFNLDDEFSIRLQKFVYVDYFNHKLLDETYLTNHTNNVTVNNSSISVYTDDHVLTLSIFPDPESFDSFQSFRFNEIVNMHITTNFQNKTLIFLHAYVSSLECQDGFDAHNTHCHKYLSSLEWTYQNYYIYSDYWPSPASQRAWLSIPINDTHHLFDVNIVIILHKYTSTTAPYLTSTTGIEIQESSEDVSGFIALGVIGLIGCAVICVCFAGSYRRKKLEQEKEREAIDLVNFNRSFTLPKDDNSTEASA